MLAQRCQCISSAMKRKLVLPISEPVDNAVASASASARTHRASTAKCNTAFPKLLDIGQKFTTMSGKSSILTDLRRLGFVPPTVATSRWAIKREKEEVAATRTPYGKLLIEREFITDDGVHNFPMQNPHAMLHVALSQSEQYATYFKDAVDRYGRPSANKPWDIVLYFDEITCGGGP